MTKRLIDRHLDPRGFISYVEKTWRVKTPFKIYARLGGFLLLEFDNEGVCKYALEKGPWFINGHVLIVGKWELGSELRKDLMNSLPIWVRFPSLGVDLSGPRSLSRMIYVLGTPLFMDLSMIKKEEMVGARICVEIRAEDKLRNTVPALVGSRIVQVPVTYDWRPSVCPNWTTFGHLKSVSPAKSTSPEGVKDAVKDSLVCLDQVSSEGVCENVRATPLACNVAACDNVQATPSTFEVLTNPLEPLQPELEVVWPCNVPIPKGIVADQT